MRSNRFLAATASVAAYLFAGLAAAKAEHVTLVCTSEKFSAVHLVIVDDGRSLAIRDEIAQTHDLYRLADMPADMIDRVLDGYLSNNAYRCDVKRSGE